MCHLELSQPGSCAVDHADHYSWGDATAIWNWRFLLWWLLCVSVLWLLCTHPRRKGGGTSIKAWACWVSETTSYEYAINSGFQNCQHVYLPDISSFWGLFLPMTVTESYTFGYSAKHIMLIIWLQPCLSLCAFKYMLSCIGGLYMMIVILPISMRSSLIIMLLRLYN